jgi:hypothetical protein
MVARRASYLLWLLSFLGHFLFNAQAVRPAKPRICLCFFFRPLSKLRSLPYHAHGIQLSRSSSCNIEFSESFWKKTLSSIECELSECSIASTPSNGLAQILTSSQRTRKRQSLMMKRMNLFLGCGTEVEGCACHR